MTDEQLGSSPDGDRRRQVDQASEDLRQTAVVLAELAGAQQRLMADLGKAVAAIPNEVTLDGYRQATERLAEEVRHGQVRLRNLVLAEGIAFLALAATVVLAVAR